MAGQTGTADRRANIPILDLSKADDPLRKPELLEQLHDALFNVGFLYIENHGVPAEIISNLIVRMPPLFDQPAEAKTALSKLNSPHFLGYSGFAEETTSGQKDLREQFDFATELPVIWKSASKNHQGRNQSPTSAQNFCEPFWRLRGPNQWPSETYVPGFRHAFTESECSST
jgi:isopenicillin N synthase-like dioxygenase